MDKELTLSLRIDTSPECLRRLCDGLAAAVKPDGGYKAATTDDPAPGTGCDQKVLVEWWVPQHGCDSLENTLDAIKGRLLVAVQDWWATALAPVAVPPAGHAERLRIVAAGIRFGYMAGHNDTVEACYGDPDDVAADQAPKILGELGDAPAPPAPERGEPADVIAHRAYVAFVQICKGRSDDAGTYEEDEALVRRALKRLDKLESDHAAPVVVPVALGDALIKAECALSDVAEGEPECDEGDPAQWAEQRCAETLAIIRPAMKRHGIRTSEWPPQPLPQGGEGEA